MTGRLTQKDMKTLSEFQAKGDLQGYYDFLEEKGFDYGKLAGSVIRKDNFNGRVAMEWAKRKAQEQGVAWTPELESQIKLGLMRSDYASRAAHAAKSGGMVEGSLPNSVINGDHKAVFGSLGLNSDTWTADGFLKAARKNGEGEAAWKDMLDAPRSDIGQLIDNGAAALEQGGKLLMNSVTQDDVSWDDFTNYGRWAIDASKVAAGQIDDALIDFIENPMDWIRDYGDYATDVGQGAYDMGRQAFDAIWGDDGENPQSQSQPKPEAQSPRQGPVPKVSPGSDRESRAPQSSPHLPRQAASAANLATASLEQRAAEMHKRTQQNQVVSAGNKSGSAVPKFGDALMPNPAPVLGRTGMPISENPAERSKEDTQDLLTQMPWLTDAIDRTKPIKMIQDKDIPMPKPGKVIRSTDPGGTWLMPNDRKPDEPLEVWQDRERTKLQADLKKMRADRTRFGFPP